jgi:hypothetical protein
MVETQIIEGASTGRPERMLEIQRQLPTSGLIFSAAVKAR